MCGIVGIASRFPIHGREWLISARDTMAHRGPDDAGAWWSEDRRVGFGHRRLAIIDLSALGHQPMRDSTGSLTITFNGEIYNYRELRDELTEKGHTFQSLSDTEVILAAYREWGADCVSRLNGMFAFALFDALRSMLFLARDRAGEKPLFYAHRDDTFCFGSELKSLMADPSCGRHFDPDSLDLYLAMGYVPGDRSLLRGARKLPPAHAMFFDLGSGATKVWRYWQLPAPPNPSETALPNERHLLDEFEVLLEDAVRRQLVADVPVGVLLSGGVDSSLITAMAVRASKRVKTFTVGFSGFGKYDEAEHARLIARHFGTDHAELNAGHAAPTLLLALAQQYDEPIVDSSMVPTYLVSQLVRKHCTVALGGDGGDELFGGYAHYNKLLWTAKYFGGVPQILRSAISRCAGRTLPLGFRGRNWLQSLSCDWRRGLPLIAVLFDGEARQHLLGDGYLPKNAEKIWASKIPMSNDLLQRATRTDFENYLPEDILVKVDRASMLNSLEVRSPLLDYRIIEFALGRVPSGLKVTTRNRKILLKDLAARLLPDKFDRKRKQGFSIPLADWLKIGVWRNFFHDILLDNGCMFNKKAIAALLRGQDRGMNNQERLFGLLMLDLWRREYKISL